MAKNEEVKAPATNGPRKVARRNQELARCRKKLKHHQKRGWGTENLETHMKCIENRVRTEPNTEKASRRRAQNDREATKLAAKKLATFREEHPNLANDLEALKRFAAGQPPA